jgi:hypothetical protein
MESSRVRSAFFLCKTPLCPMAWPMYLYWEEHVSQKWRKGGLGQLAWVMRTCQAMQ